MTKYIVSGYIGFDNFGDDAIAKVLTDRLKANNAEKITLISSNPEKTAYTYGVDSCGMLNFIPSLLESDVLISGGGSLLQDVTSIKSLIYYIGVILLGIIFRKKVVIYSQGIGPLKSKFGQFLVKTVLKHVSEISVRDIHSQELLKQWNIVSALVKDPVFDMEIEQKHETGTVGVQLRAFNSLTEPFLSKLADVILKYFPDKNFKIISLQDEVDEVVCERFTNMLNQKGLSNVSLVKNLSINDALDCISGLEYLIGMRFHANVIGIKSGVKTAAINYDPKVMALAEEYGIPLINTDGSDIEFCIKKLLQLV